MDLDRAARWLTVFAACMFLIPPVAVVSALVALACATVARSRSHRAGEPNPGATRLMRIDAVLLVVIIGGSMLYASLS
ncbi:MAG: hypothetical protein R2695_21060 [Acidimicrobiales bacterium]